MKKMIAFWLVVLLTGCQSHHKSLAKLLGSHDLLLYQNVAQGHFQETLFRAEYYSGIELSFELFDKYKGNVKPMTAIAFQDALAKEFLHIKYLPVEEQPVILMELRRHGKLTRIETLNLKQLASTIFVYWDGNQVLVKASSETHAIEIPFQMAYIIHLSRSVDMLSKVKLIEK